MPAAQPFDFASLLMRTAPFDRMDASCREALLGRSRAVCFGKGECIFQEAALPHEVCVVLEGKVYVDAVMPGEKRPTALGEHGPGAVLGWYEAMAGVPGLHAVAASEVRALWVEARAFLVVAWEDDALREAIFDQPGRDEVWRAVQAEFARRGGGAVGEAVARVARDCVMHEWPADGEPAQEGRVWVVSASDGPAPGARWARGDAKWARLVGIPEALLAGGNGGVHRGAAAGRVHGRGQDSSAGRSSPDMVRALQDAARVPRRRWRPGPAIARFFAIAALLTAGAVLWARRQPVRQVVAASGELVFAGETRDLKATVAGVMAELRVREGQRVEKGAVLAVIRPPLDERRIRELDAAGAQALAVAEFCESAAAGRYVDAVIPASAADMATEHARLRGELRVLNAIQQSNPDADGLSPRDRARVAARIAEAQAGHDEEAGAAATDAGSRREELRDAEEALRSAQDDVQMHRRSFSGSSSEDREEAARLRRDYQRVLTVLRAREGKYLAVVNRLRREINAIQQPAGPPPPPDATADIARAQSAIQSIEQRLIAHAAAQRKVAASTQEEIAQLRTAATPREIRTLQPGCVTDVAALAPGAPVDAETTLGRLVTRSAWRVRCDFPPEHTAQLAPGQTLAVSVQAAEGEALEFDEPYYLAESDPRLISLATSRDDWKDGTPVRVQTTIIAGTLLDRWMAAIGMGK